MPEGHRTLVTGALGCLGAWTLKALLELGEEPVGFDLGSDDARLRLVLSEDQRTRVTLVAGDVTTRRLWAQLSTSTRSRTSSTSQRCKCRSVVQIPSAVPG